MTRTEGQSGSALIAVLIGIAVLSIVFVVARPGSFKAKDDAVTEQLVEELRAANSEAFEVAASLFKASNFPDGIAAVYPEPYLSQTFNLVATRGTLGQQVWRLVENCIEVTRPMVAGSARPDVEAMIRDGSGAAPASDLKATTLLCPVAVERSPAYPLYLQSVTMEGTTTARGAAKKFAGVARLKPIKKKAKMPLPPPPNPTCEIEATDEVTWNKRFDARLRAKGVASIGWLHESRATPSPFQIASNGVMNQIVNDSTGKPGRVVGTRSLKGAPTSATGLGGFAFIGGLSLKVVGGVEGVTGAGSRSECSKRVKVNLPLWAQIAKLVVPLAPVPSPYVCMAKGTKIRDAAGNDRPIETLRPGDLVWSPLTGKTVAIAEVIRRPYSGRLVTVKTDKGSLRVTPEHAFLTPGGVRQARMLGGFDELVGEKGEVVSDFSVHSLEQYQGDVYNLKLATDSLDATDHLVLADEVVTGDFYLQDQSHLDDDLLSTFDQYVMAPE